jgi:hypothetical protein
MDRIVSLRAALQSWLLCPEIDEVVIVDWGSKTPVHEELCSLADSRVLFIRVEGQPYWCAARCHNVELGAVTGENLLRIDSDVRLLSGFFAHHPISLSNMFWNASWRGSHGDDCHLNGTIYTKLQSFLAVNGYNERLQSYGSEDEDLYQRMQSAGLQRVELDRSLLEHLPHDEASRLSHINSDFRASTEMSGIQLNWKIAQEQPWSIHTDRRTTWDIHRANNNLLIYTQQDDHA